MMVIPRREAVALRKPELILVETQVAPGIHRRLENCWRTTDHRAASQPWFCPQLSAPNRDSPSVDNSVHFASKSSLWPSTTRIWPPTWILSSRTRQHEKKYSVEHTFHGLVPMNNRMTEWESPY